MIEASRKPWPQVPACYGWLALDGRGQWRLQDEVVSHPGLIAFLQANYQVDQQGNWLVQNGPQKVFVELHAAPWIARLQPDHSLRAHDGRTLQALGDFLFAPDSRLYVKTDQGAALIDDRDLVTFIDGIVSDTGEPVCEQALLALLTEPEQDCTAGPDPASSGAGPAPQDGNTQPTTISKFTASQPTLHWRSHRVGRLLTSAAEHFGFVPEPSASPSPSPIPPAAVGERN